MPWLPMLACPRASTSCWATALTSSHQPAGPGLRCAIGFGQPASILAPVPGFVMYAMGASCKGWLFMACHCRLELDETAMLAIPPAQPGHYCIWPIQKPHRQPVEGRHHRTHHCLAGRAGWAGDGRGLQPFARTPLGMPLRASKFRAPCPCKPLTHAVQVRNWLVWPGYMMRPHR